MKNLKINLAFLAIVVALTTAFTTSPKVKPSSTVWFPVVSGSVQTTQGVNQDNPPSDCTLDIGTLCAQSYDISQTTSGSGGMYTLNTGQESNYILQKRKSTTP